MYKMAKTTPNNSHTNNFYETDIIIENLLCKQQQKTKAIFQNLNKLYHQMKDYLS